MNYEATMCYMIVHFHGMQNVRCRCIVVQEQLRVGFKARNRFIPQHVRLVDYYHADRSPEEREDIQMRWMRTFPSMF